MIIVIVFGFAYAAPICSPPVAPISILATARPYLAALKARRQQAGFQQTSQRKTQNKLFQNACSLKKTRLGFKENAILRKMPFSVANQSSKQHHLYLAGCRCLSPVIACLLVNTHVLVYAC